MSKIPKTLKVSISKDDIKQGKRKNPCECALAFALKRALAKINIIGNPIHVCPDWACVVDIAGRGHYSTNKKIKDFVTKFDTNRATAKPTTILMNFIVR